MKMKIKATVIEDSKSGNNRLITLECTFHRFILPEVNTYRMWSRNAASSRAVPLKRRIEEVRSNPAMPVEWGENQRGMVAENQLDKHTSFECFSAWKKASLAAADYAEHLGSLKLHKQVASRVLEPFLWHTSVISATDFTNCFTQRIHPDAQPEFRELALAMKEAISSSEPKLVSHGEWHLPYVTDDERGIYHLDILKKISVARVARSSYLNQDKKDIEADLALYDRLISADPPHLSPFEMIATPASPSEQTLGNFDGWHQLRHMVGS
jgi:hypothetical protein